MQINIVLAGAGSLGSQLAYLLAKQDRHFIIIDDDKVEKQNIAASVYDNTHLGYEKAIVASLIAKKRGAEATPIVTRVVDPSELDFDDVDLVIDCFDNVPSRALTTQLDVPVVHVGVGQDGNGMIMWDEVYQLPPEPDTRNPVCTNALGTHLLRVTALRASKLIDHWIATNEKVSDLVSKGD